MAAAIQLPITAKVMQSAPRTAPPCCSSLCLILVEVAVCGELVLCVVLPVLEATVDSLTKSAHLVLPQIL